ncbi:hypothetical protein AB1Y20_022239 [Prymnesium parvum]
MIDNRDPRRERSSNSKGARLQAERNAQIMHENNILLHKLSRVLTREAAVPRAQLLTRGLNENTRREEREKIDRDNLQLLRRLQDVKPTLDPAGSLLMKHKEHSRLLANHRNFAANPFLLSNGPLPAGSGAAAVRRRPCSAPVEETKRRAQPSEQQEDDPSTNRGPHPPSEEFLPVEEHDDES